MKSFNTCLKIAKNDGHDLDLDLVDKIKKGILTSKSGIALDRESQLRIESNVVAEIIDSVQVDRAAIIKKVKKTDATSIKKGKTVSWEDKKGVTQYGTAQSFNKRTNSRNVTDHLTGKNKMVREENLSLATLPQPKKKVEKPKAGIIGKNSDGQIIHIDNNGVRKYEEDGVLISQSVGMVPSRESGVSGEFDSVDALFKKGKTEFLTKDEVDIRQPKDQQSVPVDIKGIEDASLRAEILSYFYSELKSGTNYARITDARSKVAKALNLEAIKGGTIEAKVIDEIIEKAAVRVAKSIVKDGRKNGFPRQSIFDKLVTLQNQMPNLSVRTSTSTIEQAYSTPLPLAYLASEFAGIDFVKSVYEPSAGNGALLIGANEENVTANEINQQRYEGLRRSGIQTVTQEDGTTNVLKKAVDVIIANPPFGAVKDNDQISKVFVINDQYSTTQIDHAMVFKSLESMKKGGKAVFIIGSVMDRNTSEKNRKKLYRGKQKVQFFKTLFDNYNVVDHFSIAGKLYSKQGAAFPVDIIVIHGKGKSERVLPGVKPPRYLATIEEVRGQFDEITKLDNRQGRPGTDIGSGQDQKGSKDDTKLSQGGTDKQVPISDRPGREPERGSQDDGTQIKRPGDIRGSQSDEAGVGGIRHDGRQPDTGRLLGDDGVSGPDTGKQGVEGQQDSKGDTGVGKPGRSGSVTGITRSLEEEAIAMSEDEDALDALLDSVFEPEESFEKKKAVSKEKKRSVKPIVTPLQRQKANQRMINYYFRSKQKPKPPKKPGKKVAMHTLSGFKNGAKGLGALFNPTNTLSSGLIFNNDTWKAAKPYFVEMWNDAKKAGYTMLEFAKQVASMFDQAIRPYLRKFIQVQGKIEKELKNQKNPKPDKTEKSDTQIPYTPESGAPAIGTLTPTNMAIASKIALKKITDKHGTVDKYVATELGIDLNKIPEYFSGEQVDAIALAITNIKLGAGFIIGDQTGVGKGRVVAAMIKYSLKNGVTPIFITDKPNLYSDMYRDLSDIGMSDIASSILMTNGNLNLPLTSDGKVMLKTKTGHNVKLLAMADNKELDAGYKVIFTTYDQMNQTGASPRRTFLEEMSRQNAMLIMDESHKAGGGNAKETKEKLPRSIWFRSLINNAQSTFYSSATYAKRPDVMDLYSKTDMRLAVDDISKIGTAIQVGGIPLQQAVATMLVQAGQYVRRERSFDGVDYLTPEVKVDHSKARNMSITFKDIFKFSKTFAADAFDNIGNTAAGSGSNIDVASMSGQLNTTGFAGTMHHLIAQALLSLKTKAAVKMAIEAHNKIPPQKPILTLSYTMGTFVKEYAQENNLQLGDGIGLKFNDLLFRYLDKTRVYTEKEPFKTGPGIKHYISDSELGAEGVKEFERIKNFIYDLDFNDLPISPVDYALSEFKKAGINAAEITGRDDRIEYREDGSQRYRKRPAKEKSITGKLKVIDDFNHDRVDALIINRSASTGLSLHALPKWKGHDPAQRTMILIQPETNIDEHMQLLGRIHRAGQVKPPLYLQLKSDLPTEKRPSAVLANKMASLNANTTASKEGKLTAKDTPDFMNKYGNRVVANIMNDFPDIHRSLGRPLAEKEGTESGYDEQNAAQKITGRIPLLTTIEEQDSLYAMIESDYEALISQLNAMGQNDLEARTYDADAKILQKVEVFEGVKGTESPFTAPAYAERMDMKKPGKSYTSKEVREELIKELGIDQKVDDVSADELATYGEQKHRVQFNDTIEDFNVYRDAFLDNIKKPERRAAQSVRLEAVESDWRTIMNAAVPGSILEIPLGDIYFKTVVLKVEQKGDPKLPIALGTWKVTVAVPDSMKRIVIPFSTINRLEGFSNFGYMDADSLSAFDNATREAREDRTVMTGNMLAAYSKYPRGKIINFYDNKGDVRQGVLMPQDFNLEEAESNRKIVLDNPVDLETILDAGIFVKSRRGDFSFTSQPSGRQAISVPASKTGGSKYFQDTELIRAIGREFVKSGNRMKVKIPAENLTRTLQYLIDTKGEVFENGEKTPKVRQLLNIEAPSFEAGTDFSTDQDIFLPGQGVDLKDIQGEFPKQKVFILNNGDIAIKFKNGQGMVIKQAKTMSKEDRALAMETGRMGEDGVILGKTVGDTVTLNQFLADTKTLTHEVKHILDNLGITTKADDFAIMREFNKLKKEEKLKFTESDQRKENLANTLAQMIADRAAYRDTRLGSIIQKIMDFIDAIKNIGQMSARKFAREYESGKIFSRKVNGETIKTTVPDYEKAASEWYSKMQNVLEQKLNNGHPKMIKAQLNSWAKKGLFKKDELEWSGLIPWLESKTGKITKQEVLDYLDANQVVIEEVVKGNKKVSKKAQDARDEIQQLIAKYDTGIANEIDDTFNILDIRDYSTGITDFQVESFGEVSEKDSDRIEELHNIIYKDSEIGVSGDSTTKFSQYQLPGGKNYKEILLTLPSISGFYSVPHPTVDGQYAIKKPDGTYVLSGPDSVKPGEPLSWEKENVKYGLQSYAKNQFRRGHYNEENVIVHVRMSERTVDGKKVLHIEEVQSDWAAKGRKDGFKGDINKIKATKGKSIFGMINWTIHMPTGEDIQYSTNKDMTEKEAIQDFIKNSEQQQMVPSAPFVTKTKNYTMLAMKKMVRYAAENGFDAIAWTQGQEQADRYSLRKKVDQIEIADRINPDGMKEGKSIDITLKEGGLLTLGFKDDGIVDNSNRQGMKGKSLSDIIGKELSSRILKIKGHETFYNEDLKVGGEGMKAFYDKMLPNEMNKFFNKKAWGKAKVGEIEIETQKKVERKISFEDFVANLGHDPFDIIDEGREEEFRALYENEKEAPVATKLHAIPITDQMRSKALREGMPLFKTAPKTSTQAFKKWFGKSMAKRKKDGAPLVFLHGTPNEFTVFKDKESGKSTGHAASGLGNYFTQKEGKAFHYSQGTGHVMQVYLKAEKPYKMTLKELQSFYTVDSAIKRRDELKAKGHDSIIVPASETGDTEPIVIVFDSNNIKSTQNQGTFDLENPDIMFQTSDDFKNIENEIYRDALDILIESESRRKKQRVKSGKGFIDQERKDISSIAMALKTTFYNAYKIGGAAKRTFDIFRRQTDWKFEKINQFLFNNEHDLQKTLTDYRKQDKTGYKELNRYVLNQDKNAIGHIVEKSKKGGFSLLHHERDRNGSRKFLGTFKTEDEAWAASRRIEANESSLNSGGKNALIAMRTITRSLYKYYSEEIGQAIDHAKKSGQPIPKVITMREGESVKINLDQALKELGNRQGYYFPRLRQAGQYRVLSSKNGKSEIKFFDIKKLAQWHQSKKIKQGFTSQIKHVGRTSEDVFQSLGTVLDKQQAINKVLRNIANKDKTRALEDVNIFTEWEGDDLILNGHGVDKILAKQLEDLGGILEKEELDDAIRYSIRFPDVQPKDISPLKQQVTDTALYSNSLLRDTDVEFAGAFAKEFATLLKSRGSMARMIGRSDAVGEKVSTGYEEDLIKAVVQTATSAAGGYAKGRVASEATRAMSGYDTSYSDFLSEKGQKLQALQSKAKKDKSKKLAADIQMEKTRLNEEYHSEAFKKGLQEDKQNRIYKDLKATLQDIMKGDEAIDRILGTLKGLSVLKYLGFRVSSAAINLTALVTGVPAVFSGETKGRISLNKAIRSVTRAGTEFFKSRVGKSKYQELFDDIRRRGFDEPKLNKEAFRELQGKLGSGWNNILEISMYMFGMTEKFNRAVTISAAYMALKDTHNPKEHGPWNHEEMIMKARELSDHSHGIYEKSDRPFYIRGDHVGAKVGQMTYVFHKFIHNYVQEMVRLGYDKKEYKAALYMMLSPAMFGIGSTVPLGIAKAIASALDADDPEEELIKFAEDNFGKTAGRAARYGITGMGEHGVSLKGSLATRFGTPDTFYEIFGAPGSAIGDIASGAKSAWKGKYREAAEKALPTAMGGALKAYREATEGVTTRSGSKVFFGKKQIKGDTIDTITRALGFNPTHISEKKEIKWNESKVRAKYNKRKQELYKRFKDYYYQPAEHRNKMELHGIYADARDFNLEIKDKGMTRFITPFSKKTINLSLKRGSRPSKSEMRRRTN